MASLSPTSRDHAAGVEADGLLVVDKPLGLTSHAVVSCVRRLTGIRRVGHVGSLDPLATGVLVLCLGRATRIAEYLMEGDKAYRAIVRFGVVTDTWDAEGAIVAEADATALTAAAIAAALPAFAGDIMQTPPMYSALKRDGRPLYSLARQGVTVERQPRPVTVRRLVLTAWLPPEATLEIVCSRGTYVRALAHDLGQMLGVGAHLAGLTRLAVGTFGLEQAVTLDQLAAEAPSGAWRERLLPMAAGLSHLPSTVVSAEALAAIAQGRQVALDMDLARPLCCACDAQGRLVAILTPDRTTGLWQPHKVLLGAAPEDAQAAMGKAADDDV